MREASERAWASWEPRAFEDWVAAGVGGVDWVRGTRWTGGLADGDIDAIEQRLGAPLGAQHRLFLATLHATEPIMRGARFVDPDGATMGEAPSGGVERMEPIDRPGFYHWLRDELAIAEARRGVVDGIAFDVEHNALWPTEWGARPTTAEERRARLLQLVDAAPPLLPLYAHRFAVGGLHGESGVVLSVYQSDIIVYGSDLRGYLLNELSELIDVPRTDADDARAAARIPFWGRFVCGDWR